MPSSKADPIEDAEFYDRETGELWRLGKEPIQCDTTWQKRREISAGVHEWVFECRHTEVVRDDIGDGLGDPYELTHTVQQHWIGDGSYLPPVDMVLRDGTPIYHPGIRDGRVSDV